MDDKNEGLKQSRRKGVNFVVFSTLPSRLIYFKDDSNNRIAIKINGKEENTKVKKGCVVLSGTWKKGDQISLSLPMEDRILESHEEVRAKAGLQAIQHGPLYTVQRKLIIR